MLNEIVEWNKERNIPQLCNPMAEMGHLLEEMTEFARAGSPEGAIDALCDIIVFATGTIWKLGYDPEKCMQEVLKEINDRGGSFDESIGKWVKELKETQYKADFNACLLEDLTK